MPVNRRLVAILILLVVTAAACGRVARRTVSPNAVSSLDERSPFLKVHFSDGTLYILGNWSVDEDARIVTGAGNHYAPDRTMLGSGSFTLGVDSVAVFETNVRQMSPVIAPLAIITGISVAITIACAMNWKQCFGSCPTFYIDDDGTEALRAEGFSASIAPWLEATDVDALRVTRDGGSRVEIRMTNEAQETHVVRHADVLAFPVGDGETIRRDPWGAFHATHSPRAPSSCIGPEGEFRERVAAFDGEERVSAADSTNLATRETVDVTFPASPGSSPGLAVGARQTLLTTFLLYETLSNMGTEVGSWMARWSTSTDRSLADATGGIDVLVRDGEGWRLVATVGEHGPIAADEWVVPLPEMSGAEPTVRLRMTRGNWRVDYLALVTLDGTVDPVRLAPDAVLRDGRRDDDALAALWSDADVITTFPGDEVDLEYQLPGEHSRYQLFLESRGYYLEWIRDEWLAGENHAYAAQMLLNTDAALIRLAPEFKRIEATMEEVFWGSRYAKP